MSLTSNKTKIQSLLDGINALPEASTGVELPELSNPGDAASLLEGKELINGNGAVVTGTMPNNGSVSQTIDGLETQSVTVPSGYTSGGTISLDDTIDNLADDQASKLAEALAALDGKTAGGGTAEPVLQEKTVTPTTSTQTVQPDSGYDGLSKVTVNSMPTATQATPSISVSNSGLITASATQSAGYVAAGTKSNTKQLTTQGAKTITPSKSSQTAVSSGVYTTGAVTVAAIPSQYADTSDANAVAAHILNGETAYVDGEKITGTMPDLSDFSGLYPMTITPSDDSGFYGSGEYVLQINPDEGYHSGGSTFEYYLPKYTITPTKETQTKDCVIEGSAFGKVTVNPIPSQYIETTDATAAAADIVESKTAYVNGTKVTGTNPYAKTTTDTEVNTQATKLAELKSILEGKASGGSGGGSEISTVVVTWNNSHGDSMSEDNIWMGTCSTVVDGSIELGGGGLGNMAAVSHSIVMLKNIGSNPSTPTVTVSSGDGGSTIYYSGSERIFVYINASDTNITITH